MLRPLLLLFAVLAALPAGAANITSATCTPSNSTGCANLTIPSPSTTASVTVEVSGTWVATLAFEGSLGGSTFRPLVAVPSEGGAYASSVTSNGLWQVHTAGAAYVRVRATSYTSGTAVVTLSANTAPPFTDVVRAVGGTFGSVAIQGTVELGEATRQALATPSECTFPVTPPITALTTAVVQVPATPFADRTQMTILNMSTVQEVWCCRGDACTPTSAGAYVIPHGSALLFDRIRESTVIRCRTAAGTGSVNVVEVSCPI